ncbi:histamine H2 receptor [Biomphalaria glabrata]|nr:histamine H2 receptor [Biomphalaria glabrata]
MLVLESNLINLYLYTAVLVHPLIAIAGLIGNILSVRMLIKSGLDKSSNILLLSLCVADSFCLISALNIPNIITFFPGKRPFGYNLWEYSMEASFILYVLAITFQICFFFGTQLSSTLVTLITVERFLAVFFPLHFKIIVTKKRTWLVVILSYILWLPYPVYLATCYRFFYFYYPMWDVYAGGPILIYNSVMDFIERNIVSPIAVYIPFMIVTVGSLLIAVRVRLTMVKRQAMVSSQRSLKTSRTTRTLLTVCVVFSVTKIVSLMSFFIDLTQSASDVDVYLRLYLGIIVSLIDYLNASSNFIIYLILNDRFRKIAKEIVKCN